VHDLHRLLGEAVEVLALVGPLELVDEALERGRVERTGGAGTSSS
jgi:hypothetical protein